MKRFLLLALLAVQSPLEGRTDARLLDAIGDVETGSLRNPRGAVGKAGERGRYQMKGTAWTDANRQLISEGHPPYPYSRWQDSVIQDIMASAYLRCLRKRLQALGMPNPSPALIALCWNRGITGARRLGWQPNDYAQRVANLFDSLPR